MGRCSDLTLGEIVLSVVTEGQRDEDPHPALPHTLRWVSPAAQVAPQPSPADQHPTPPGHGPRQAVLLGRRGGRLHPPETGRGSEISPL